MATGGYSTTLNTAGMTILEIRLEGGKKFVAIDNTWREYTEQRWRGHTVFVTDAFPTPHAELCRDDEHELSVMHHRDENGRHYCPTGFLECDKCGGVADDPNPQPCEHMRHER